jgi:hypothetical protein
MEASGRGGWGKDALGSWWSRCNELGRIYSGVQGTEPGGPPPLESMAVGCDEGCRGVPPRHEVGCGRACWEADPGAPARRSFFFSYEEGVYLTFTSQEIKIRACRTVMQIVLIVAFFATYYLTWGICDYCILVAAGASCGGVCAGMTFLSPSCWAGVLACLLRGFRIGNEIASVEVHWKVR